VNKPPSAVARIPDQVVAVDSAVVVDLRPYFADPDGDTLTYAATSSGTATAAVAVSGSMVTVTGVAAGSTSVTVTARDPEGLTVEQVFGVTVPNRAPLAVGTIADRSVYVDSTATVDVAERFTDPDGDALAYAAASSDASRVAVDVSGAAVTVTGMAVGNATLTVTATDPGGLAAEQVFEVTVPNRAPRAVDAIEDRVVEVDSVVAVDVAAHFTDPDRDSLEYSAASSDATRATIEMSGGVLTVTGVASGAATVTVTAADPGGLTAEQVFDVAVPNRPPVVSGRIGDREVHVGDTVVVDLADHFADPDGDALEYAATAADTARASVSVSGSMVTIAGATVGSTTVAVTARDTAGLEAGQSFGVTIPNRAPVAVGAIADREIHVGDVAAVDVAAHFTDPDGQTLQDGAGSWSGATGTVAAAGGTVKVAGKEVGSATVTVTAEDPGGLLAEQVFVVTVPNRAPVPVGTIADREVEVDSVGELDVARFFAEPDGQVLEYSATSTNPDRAAVTVSGSTMTVTGVAAGRTTVTVLATDPGGLRAEQSFGVLVPNRPPLAVGTVTDRKLFVGDTVAVDMEAYFSDPDGDTLAYAAASADAARASVSIWGGTLTVRGRGVGGVTVTVTARDPEGLAAGQRFRVTVPNRAPEPVGTMGDREVHVGDTVVADVEAHFTDPDGHSLEYAVASSDPTRVRVSLSGSAITVRGAGVGTATVTVTARDPEGLAAEQRFAVSVPNRAPQAVGTIPDAEIHVGDAVVVDLAGYFTDPDGEELAYTAVPSSTGAATVDVSASLLSVAGVAVGNLTVTVTARDPGGLAAEQRFRVTVPNRPPAAVGTIPDAVLVRDSFSVFDVAEYFTDPDGQVLRYSTVSSDSATATATVSGTTMFLEGVAHGTATVTVTARDPGELTAEQTFRVTVPNRPPVAVGAIADREVEADSAEAVDVVAYFRDPDGDELRYGATSSDAARAAVSSSGSVVTVRGVAGGSATVTVTATDPGGSAAEQLFVVTVPNRAPEPAGAMDDLFVEPGTSAWVGVSPHFTDPDGDDLTYAATSSNTAVATVEVAGDTVTVAGDAEGRATITVTARDPGGLTATQRFDATVEVPNSSPEPVDTIPGRTIDAGEELSIDVEPYFWDPDGDELEYEAISSSEAVATADMEDATRLNVEGLARGAATVTVTATDPGGLSAVQEFDVEVPNQAPYVDREIEDLPDATPGERYRAVLTTVFVDPDGDSLAFRASSSDTDVAETEIRGDTIHMTAVDVGTATITVTATDSAGLSATDEFEFRVISARFDIGLRYTSDVTDTLRSLIRKTRDEWKSILYDTELNDVKVPDIIVCLGLLARNVGVVDDHLVLMDVREIDGAGGTLAYAGYCYRRVSDGSPIVSAVAFDEADVDTLLAYGSTEDVIFHEIAHGLGFSSRHWNYKDLLETGDDPHFEGELAIEAFDDAGGEDYEDEKVPISSPDHSHWRKSVFGREGMTPSLKLGAKNPFSAITLQAMADVGYEVDVSLADDYELPDNSTPPPGPRGDTARVLDLSNDVAWTPVTVLAPDGRIIRVIRPPPGPETHRFGLLETSRLREATLEDLLRPARPEDTVGTLAQGRTTMWRLVR